MSDPVRELREPERVEKNLFLLYCYNCLQFNFSLCPFLRLFIPSHMLMAEYAT